MNLEGFLEGVTRALRKSTIRIVASELQNLRKSKYQNKYRSGTRMLTQQVPEPGDVKWSIISKSRLDSVFEAGIRVPTAM
ncbi:hypothetical protein Y1Q_0014449 [Alligator mississippiensis]|uniref:Uncharacterized protein n=1 Tax=Alligator mississippiensis TaxID=8496 RepID=A0A151PCT5_ALLMI|nr:hypothetical protein Y1Q_0014449 [Alligator mississippiensis]